MFDDVRRFSMRYTGLGMRRMIYRYVEPYNKVSVILGGCATPDWMIHCSSCADDVRGMFSSFGVGCLRASVYLCERQ